MSQHCASAWVAACADCPFRTSACNGYDQDGLDCLEEGREPGCHAHVGDGRQFDNPLHAEHEVCRGFLAWLDGVSGFQRPALAE